MLSPGECRALLRAGSIGRVALSVGALPAIFPVRYQVVDDDIVFGATPAAGPVTSVNNAVIAFQADAFDAAGEAGWSVLVVGRAEHTAATGVTRIPSDHITGYRFDGPDALPGARR
jgi:uncharacterized protein